MRFLFLLPALILGSSLKRQNDESEVADVLLGLRSSVDSVDKEVRLFDPKRNVVPAKLGERIPSGIPMVAKFSDSYSPLRELTYVIDTPRPEDVHRGARIAAVMRKASELGLSAQVLGSRYSTDVDIAKVFQLPEDKAQELKDQNAEVFIYLTLRQPGLVTMDKIITSYARDPKLALGVGITIIQALKDLHQKGRIVHGIISPRHIQMSSTGKISFSGFYGASFADSRGFQTARAAKDVADRSDLGAYMFMHPSLMHGERGSFRTDLWSAVESIITISTGSPLVYPDNMTRESLYRWKLEHQELTKIPAVDNRVQPSPDRVNLRAARAALWDAVNTSDPKAPNYDLVIQRLREMIDIL